MRKLAILTVAVLAVGVVWAADDSEPALGAGGPP
jgi:hypothetical protein